MGVPTRKFVSDLWIYQELVHERRPDIIIEIGSLFGGTTLFLAHLLDLVGHGKVISIDRSRQVFEISHPRVVEITGDSENPETIEAVRTICGSQTVMVIHDGSHNYEQVVVDLNLYAPIVTRGQYLVIEDGVVDLFENEPETIGATYAQNFPSGGPLKAVATFLQAFPDEFEIDESRERFLVTASPRGYLLKK